MLTFALDFTSINHAIEEGQIINDCRIKTTINLFSTKDFINTVHNYVYNESKNGRYELHFSIEFYKNEMWLHFKDYGIYNHSEMLGHSYMSEAQLYINKDKLFRAIVNAIGGEDHGVNYNYKYDEDSTTFNISIEWYKYISRSEDDLPW